MDLIEQEQIKKAEERERVFGIHYAPVKKGKKCVNKKPRFYSKNVVIKMNPDSVEFQERLAKIKAKIRK